MAAGNFTVTHAAKLKIANGTFGNMSTATYKAALVTASSTLTAAGAPATYAAITNQVANGNGYSTGGATLTGITVTESGGTVTFDAADVAWNSATFTAKWVVIYSDTATNKDVLGFMDLETTGSVSPSNGTLTVQWNAAGLFTLS